MIDYYNTVTLLAKNQEHIKNHINIFVSQLEQTFLNLCILYAEDKVLLFKKLENYYQLAGLQVNFVKDKIIFAI